MIIINRFELKEIILYNFITKKFDIQKNFYMKGNRYEKIRQIWKENKKEYGRKL